MEATQYEPYKIKSDVTLTTSMNKINNTVRICSENLLNEVQAWNPSVFKEEEKKMNKFLEIKESQEIDKINDEFFKMRKSIIESDKIYKILLKAEKEINEIYKEEDSLNKINISYLDYTTLENSNKIDELRQEKDKEIKEVRQKYAEIKALVEDIPAKDRIDIYKEYRIM